MLPKVPFLLETFTHDCAVGTIAIGCSWQVHDICTLLFLPVPVQIVITPDDRHFYVNSSVLLTCAAYGTPLPTITWSKEGRTLTDVTVRNDVVVKNGTKFVRSILQFCSTQVARHVQYACTADNEVTNDTATFQLTTQGTPPPGHLWYRGVLQLTLCGVMACMLCSP